MSLKQGDCSPLFYSQGGQNPFSQIISIGEKEGLISGFNIRVENFSRSHLQFSDDTLILLDGYEKSLTNLKHLIHSFELVSGLKVNWSKRFLHDSYGQGIYSEFANLMGCSKGE